MASEKKVDWYALFEIDLGDGGFIKNCDISGNSYPSDITEKNIAQEATKNSPFNWYQVNITKIKIYD